MSLRSIDTSVASVVPLPGISGTTPEGKKGLVGLIYGVRESTKS
jgi:hypothetical protein